MNEQLIEYYCNLLIIQYQNKPKAKQTICALINQMMIYDIIIQVRDGYDIDTAIGHQLDILGKYLGVDRVVTGVDFTRDWYGFSDYGDTAPFDNQPMIDYGDEIPDYNWYTYADSKQSLFSLLDPEFRQILRFKLIQNYSNLSNKDIDEFLFAYFGNSVIFTDRENMTISYVFDEEVERLVTIAKSEMLLPKPAGVALSVTFVPDITQIYTMIDYGQTAPDFGVGFLDYGDTAEGSWLDYGG